MTAGAAGRLVPLGVALVLAGVAGVVLDQTRGLLDLEVYRYGGRAVLDGVPLYGGRDPVTDLPFTYPPFAALVLVPVALVPGTVAAALWTALSVGGLVAVVAVAVAGAPGQGPAPAGLGRSAGTAPWPDAPAAAVVGVAAACVVLEPVWQTLAFGQVNLVLLVLVVVDLLSPDRRWAGVLVGVAAGIKLTPLVFVVMLFLVGRRAAAGRAVGTFLLTLVVGFVVLPATAWTFWSDAISDPERVGGPAYAGNQSVYGALARLVDGEPSRVLWVLVAGPLAVGVLAVAAAVWRRGDRVLGTGLGGLAMLVASPISWSHHWVWAVLVGVALVARSWRWGLAWAVVFVAAPGWWFPHGDDREHGWGVVAHVLGNAYLLAALVVAGWAAWTVRPGSGGRGRHVVAGVDREHALDGA